MRDKIIKDKAITHGGVHVQSLGRQVKIKVGDHEFPRLLEEDEAVKLRNSLSDMVEWTDDEDE